MTTAPVIYTSNMSPTGVACQETAEDFASDEAVLPVSVPSDAGIPTDVTSEEEFGSIVEPGASNEPATRNEPAIKKVRLSKNTATETELRIARLSNQIDHEKRMWQIKEDHEIRLNALKKNHIVQIYQAELTEAQAKAELAKLLLRQNQK